MCQIFGPLLRSAAVASAFAFPLAQAATVIDFEPAALTGLYLPADTFVQGGYTLTTKNDFGIIDTAPALGGVSPTGNATQFYFNANDGALSLARTDTAAFSLEGFSAAFVPLDPASTQVTVIVATGTKLDNSVVTASWTFASSLTSHYAFGSYAGPAAFAPFTGLAKVEFRACSWVGGVACTQATQDNGQFAIDDILVSAVPEPTITVLMTLGLLGLGVGLRLPARRNAR